MAKRITRLIGEIQRDPFSGIGKPEPLKGDLSGYWSRRIDDEHRLVYRADDKEVKILKARYHYSDWPGRRFTAEDAVEGVLRRRGMST